MAQCWQLAHGTKPRSYGVQYHGRCREILSIVLEQSTAFSFPRLVNFLQLPQRLISKYGTHARGSALQNSRQLSMKQSTTHSHGRLTANTFFQQALDLILPYGSGMHRHGSKLEIPGVVILTRS